MIWAGSDDGYVHVTRNAGEGSEPTWELVTPPDAPDFVRINTIEVSPNTPGKAYVAGIRYLVDNDRSPYIWKTEDYGETWTKIVHGIPDDDFIRAVREDPTRSGLLYAASERTVYVSWNDGSSWQPLTMNLPVTQVSDLVVEDHDLVIGTHGRGFWVMRSIGPLRQLTDEVADADFWLFDPKDPVRRFDNAVSIDYILSSDAGHVSLEFMDSSGDVLASYEASADDEDERVTDEPQGYNPFGGGGSQEPGLSAGSNRFRWNMRLEGWTDFDGRIFWAAGNQGPSVLPGEYRVRLTVDGESMTQNFEIKMNPRAVADGVTASDLEERFNFAIRIRDRVSDANEAVLRMRSIKAQINDRIQENENAQLAQLGEAVSDRLSEVEGEVYQVQNRSNQDPLNYPIKLNNKIAALQNLVEGAETRPTEQSYAVFENLSGQLEGEIEQMNLVIQQDLARLNELLRELGLEPIDTDRLIT